MDRSITRVDDQKLVNLISNATRRVVFVAPGVSLAIGKAICSAWQRLGAERVSVVLDVDPEVCRLGYGTIEGLEAVRDAAGRASALVCHQPGVRIGLLIADDITLVYSPTPLLVEAGSSQPERPNAIQLGTPPAELMREVGAGPNGAKDRVIGLDPLKPEQVAAAKQDLQNAPPVRFDLARRVRVFTARFQFVELEMTGCFLSLKRVPIPSNLVGLARNNDVGSQFHAHFNLVSGAQFEVKAGNKVLTERKLRKRKEQILKDYLISLPGYGRVVLRANKPKLEIAVASLKEDVAAFESGVKEMLQQRIDENVSALVEALLPAVLANPPDEYTKMTGPGIGETELRSYLAEDISQAFGEAADFTGEMKVTLVFKDLAYESLTDPKFLEVARAAMPRVKYLHEEFDASRAEAVAGL